MDTASTPPKPLSRSPGLGARHPCRPDGLAPEFQRSCCKGLRPACRFLPTLSGALLCLKVAVPTNFVCNIQLWTLLWYAPSSDQPYSIIYNNPFASRRVGILSQQVIGTMASSESSSTKPIPVLLTGTTTMIGTLVVAALKPEYEGMRSPFIPSLSPALLSAPSSEL
jgi:hypothetical protein